MLSRFDGLLEKGFLGTVTALTLLALLLLALLGFVADSPRTSETSFALFLAATMTLIACYMTGVIAIAFLAIFILTRAWKKN
jgi:hypothetical protein